MNDMLDFYLELCDSWLFIYIYATEPHWKPLECDEDPMHTQ